METCRAGNGDKVTYLKEGQSVPAVVTLRPLPVGAPRPWAVGWVLDREHPFQFLYTPSRRRAAELHGLCVLALTQGGAFPEGDAA